VRSFLIRKIIASIITLFAIVTANFVIFRMAPGDPIRLMFKDPRFSAEQLQQQIEKFGLDGSMWDQYVAYMKNLFQGDLGISFWQKRPVVDVIASRIPQTLLLVLTALTLAVHGDLFRSPGRVEERHPDGFYYSVCFSHPLFHPYLCHGDRPSYGEPLAKIG